MWSNKPEMQQKAYLRFLKYKVMIQRFYQGSSRSISFFTIYGNEDIGIRVTSQNSTSVHQHLVS